jgi:hypothetical protein
MYLTRVEIGTSFHVLKVSFALATAKLNSSFVDYGTLAINS